jgi:hypothetical protein
MKLNLKLNVAAMNKEESPPQEEERVSPPAPVVKPLNLSLGIPKLNVPSEAPKEEKVAEEKKQRVKVDLLVGNLLEFSVDAQNDESSRKRLVTEEVRKKFKMQKSDKMGFELFALRPLNGESDEFTYVCKPTSDGTF